MNNNNPMIPRPFGPGPYQGPPQSYQGPYMNQPFIPHLHQPPHFMNPGHYPGGPPYANYGMPPGPPMLNGPMPIMAPGTTIVKPPTYSAPPPGWTGSLTSVTSSSNAAVRKPLKLWIGKIPPSLEDSLLVKILECCGKIQNWNRPLDSSTQEFKAFGFCTFEYGINALRCMNVLGTGALEIHGAPLQIKAAKNEQAALDSMIEDEINEGQNSAELDALVRTKILNLITPPPALQIPGSTLSKENVDATPLSETAGSTAVPKPSDDDLVNSDKQILTEIEKFRLRQAQRDKEAEEQKKAKIREKMLEFNRKQELEAKKAADASTVNDGDQGNKIPELDSIKRQDEENKRRDRNDEASNSAKERERREKSDRAGSRRQRSEREGEEDPEQLEAKRLRKQQVLEMLASESMDRDSETPTSNMESEIIEPVAKVGHVVKIGSGSNTTLPKKGTKSNQGMFGREEEEEGKKPLRTIVPLEYTEEEQKEVLMFKHVYDDPDEDLDGGIKKKDAGQSSSQATTGHSTAASSAQALAMKQAQAISAELAAKKAAEIAAKLSQQTGSTSIGIETSSPRSKQMTDEEQQKIRQRQLVDQIPTDRKLLFEYDVDWKKVEALGIVNATMRQWVVKKVVEYLGEEEETLTNFIISKLVNRCNPGDLLKELTAVLDDDAEQFVVKLWRMLIFSILKHE